MYAATYADELPVLTEDLSPVEHPHPAVASRASHAQVTGEPGGTAFFVSLMGGIEIIVPDDTRIVDSGAALMGDFVVDDHHSCTISHDDLPASAPVLHIWDFALMGGGHRPRGRGARM